MSTTLLSIYNLALSACGSSLSVANPEERSREADLCRLWYTTARNSVLAAAPWPSVRKYARLPALTERNPDDPWTPSSPHPEFRYLFACPSDMLQPYRLQSYGRFEYGLVGNERRISADEPAPILFYNSLQEDVTKWEQGLGLAVTYTLAFHLSKPLTGRSSTQETNAMLAESYVEAAKVAAANSQELPEEDLPDWLQARGFSQPLRTKFFYPMQALNLQVSK